MTVIVVELAASLQNLSCKGPGRSFEVSLKQQNAQEGNRNGPIEDLLPQTYKTAEDVPFRDIVQVPD